MMKNDNTANGGTKINSRKLKGWRRIVTLCLAGVVLNFVLSNTVKLLGLPLYLDNVGTMLCAVLGGWLPGVVVGLTNNVINCITDPSSIYYGFISTLIATVTLFFFEKGKLKKPVLIVPLVLLLALIGGGIGTFLPWFLDGVPFDHELLHSYLAENGLSPAQAQLAGNLLLDIVDKLITVLAVIAILRFIPDNVKEKLRGSMRMQARISDKEYDEIRRIRYRSVSVRTRIILILTITLILVGTASSVISVTVFHHDTMREHQQYAEGAALLAATMLDGDKVDEYISSGKSSEEYVRIEKQLYSIRDFTPDVKYIYIYKILEDGCHVVFDLDTDDLPGEAPGTVVPFDESFGDYIPMLLAGEKVDPIVSDDTYGWLLTVYEPVYDSQGKCVCYAAADVSMDRLRLNERSFFTEMISLFLGFFILILAFVWQMVEYNIVLPVNTMAHRADGFAFSGEFTEENVEKIRSLDIHTGDEIENLYRSILKMSEDTVSYVNDINEKNETISKMQRALIILLADMVESRDKSTGDHVRKTAAYVEILLNEMREMGIYSEKLTDQYIQNVIDSAPLHDVGKIVIPDAILNKPGKLTDEEFEIMKGHTTAGRDIIARAINSVPDSAYLYETKNLAMYHHEKWNGKGYPSGLSGEDIPLSARVMAVADVMDALVSRRSYKEPFTFEKACEIILEGRGTHFDPQIIDAFVSAEDKIREVMESFNSRDA